jgi:hypothetical protein
MAYYRKLQAVPHTSEYCWNMGDRGTLDPTDAAGLLCEPLPLTPLLPSLTLLSVDTTLALINEPAPGEEYASACPPQACSSAPC